MKEEIYKFGKTNGLVGTATYPNMELENLDIPAILLWNAGLVHRVGPYRLNVDLARRLASEGFPTFRFDISGKGDSEKRNPSRTDMERSISEIQDSMDFISEKIGANHFVLIGLCSGADQTHPVALLDKRVSGAVFLDGCGYRTCRFYVHYTAVQTSRWVFKPRKWKTLIKKIYNVSKSKMRFSPDVDLKDVWSRRFPSREKAKSDIIQMIDRGVNLLYVYTGGVRDYYSYHSQFEDMFGLKVENYKNKLQLEYFPEADHIYTLMEDRIKLINTISNWMQLHYMGTKKETDSFDKAH